MNIVLFGAIATAFSIIIVVTVIFYGKRSGWLAVMFVSTGITALILSVFTDVNWLISVLNVASSALFLTWILIINRAKKGDRNDSDVSK